MLALAGIIKYVISNTKKQYNNLMLHLVKAYSESTHTALWSINAIKTGHNCCSLKADIKKSLTKIKLYLLHLLCYKCGVVLSFAAKYYHSMW